MNTHGYPSGFLWTEAPMPQGIQLSQDFAAQRPDCEILGIYTTRREAEDNRPPGAHVVMRWSSGWSKPLT